MRNIWSFSVIATLAFIVQLSGALAQGVSSSSDVLKLAIAQEELELSESARIISLDATKFRNDQTQWTFEILDGDNIHKIRLRGDRDQTMDTKSRPDWNNSEFLALLPSMDDLDTVESYVEKAKAELASAHPELVPRDQYIVEYKVCEPPASGEVSEYASQCQYDKPRELWTIILKSDVTGSDDYKTKAIYFHDGVFKEITGAAVGGNW